MSKGGRFQRPPSISAISPHRLTVKCYNLAMKVSEIGEFGLINRLVSFVNIAIDKRWKSWRQLIIGIGDDAAVWKPRNPYQIATVDSLVENVHFSFKYTTWRELGWKSIAVNLSDIAAMGGVPMYALISLGLPESTDVRNADDLYGGMVEMTDRFAVSIIGGDTVSSPFVFVSVTIMGCASNERGDVLRRAAAQPGDVVAVTNSLGASAAGLAMLSRGLEFPANAAAELKRAHLKPDPRIAEGQVLVTAGVKAGMDISDGLVGDLTHICEMSKVGARLNVDLVPVSPAAATCFGSQALQFALNGGEDYELLFTAPAKIVRHVQRALDCVVTPIGEITAAHSGKVELVDAAGRAIDLRKAGWDHFSR
jgi:thiamine-monophosphate kinase